MRTKDGVWQDAWMRQRVVAGVGDGDDRLERRVHDLLRLEHVLEHMIGGRHGTADIAAAELIVERDVGVQPPCHRSAR